MSDEAPETPPVVGRPLRLAALAGLCVFVLIGMWVLHYRSWTQAPLSGVNEDIEVEIGRGDFGDTIEALEDAGILHRDLYLRIFARGRGDAARVRAGTYVVTADMSPTDLLDLLTHGGRDDEILLTIPEGYTIFHVADRVARLELMSRRELLDAATDDDLLDSLGIEGESAEGYLFPDTYRVRPGTSAKALVRRMVARQRQVWAEVVADVGADEVQHLRDEEGLTNSEFLTLASIIEREAIVDDERPIIARVFYNRLDKGMKLQTDPTCIYGPRLYKQKPSPRTCRAKNSRYSTYVIDGLPPGPISNPGRRSIRAALAPTTDSRAQDYLYFVARGGRSKRHTFSKTYKAHRRAVGR